ncbi:helix-turn-helix domain-containing protein [Desulfurobacterium sp.]
MAMEGLEILGEKIKKARKELGFKRREDFAKFLDIDTSLLAKYEQGKEAPPFKIIGFLCKKLGIPPRGFIYGNYLGLSFRGSYRLKESDKLKIASIAQNINSLIEFGKIYHNRFDFIGHENPRVAARTFIEHYNLNKNGFNTWRVIKDLLSERDIFIFAIPLNSKSAAIPQEEPFFIVLNSNEPKDRWSFSLLHEIGHLIAPEVFRKNENYANEFASAVLIPEDYIPRLWKELGNYIINWKLGNLYYKIRELNKFVSPEAVCYSLVKTYLPNKKGMALYSKFKKFASQERKKEKESNNKPFIAFPKKYAQKVCELYKEGKITYGRMKELFFEIDPETVISKCRIRGII